MEEQLDKRWLPVMRAAKAAGLQGKMEALVQDFALACAHQDTLMEVLQL